MLIGRFCFTGGFRCATCQREEIEVPARNLHKNWIWASVWNLRVEGDGIGANLTKKSREVGTVEYALLTRERNKMNAILTRKMATLGMALGLGCGSQVLADTTGATPKEKTLKGLALRIDPVGKTVLVKGFWGTKRLNVAEDCRVLSPEKSEAGLADLRTGQALAIHYQSVQGVLVAHQIAQQNLTFAGVVGAIDPANHTLTLRRHALDKTFQIGDGCKVVLRDDRAGTLADVLTGHRVKVIYEIPNGTATARQIAQKSAAFSGALTAVDLNDRTLKAKNMLSAKTFNVADGCTIVIAGKPDARLSDLKLGEKLVFNYEEVKGVNIVNRIGTAEAGQEPPTTASGQPHNSGVPTIPSS